MLWFLLIFVVNFEAANRRRPEVATRGDFCVKCSSGTRQLLPDAGRTSSTDPTVCVYDQQAQWDDELAARNVSKCCGRLGPSSSSTTSSVDSLGCVGVDMVVVSVANEVLLKRDTW